MEAAESPAHWLAATAAGDARAFAQLYECCAAPLYGLLLQALGREDWAEQALLRTLLRVWHRRDVYTPEKGPPMQWLSALARYRALETLRASRASAAGPLESVRPAAADEAPAVEGSAHAFGDALQALSPNVRSALMLALRDGYTHAELARAQQLPPARIRRELRGALARLRGAFATLE